MLSGETLLNLLQKCRDTDFIFKVLKVKKNPQKQSYYIKVLPIEYYVI